MDIAPMQVLLRFGLGGTAGTRPPTDPQDWLRAQLTQPDPAQLDPTPTTAEALEALKYDRQNKPLPGQSHTRALYRRDAQAALTAAMTTPAPFRERLVWFWTNHFTVSTRHGRVAGLIGPFIQEAIRPHVTGRFSDMLLAVMRHPAMLIYLDNAGSVGPNSRAGLRTHRGLNENLARECLELHTVTPAAGYTQADVTSFARILTGWSIDLKQDPPGFRFRPFAHEPGEQTLMGHRFPPGEQGGVEALRFLGTHPATYHHIATQLVCHFVADNTPPNAVEQIEGVLYDTRGDLGAASLALINLRGAWQPQTKTLFSPPSGFSARQRPRPRRWAPCSFSANQFGAPRSPTAGPTEPPTGPPPRQSCAGSTSPMQRPALPPTAIPAHSPQLPSVP